MHAKSDGNTHGHGSEKYMRPHKAIQGQIRPYEATCISSYKATLIHYHNVPQKITFCSHCNWDVVNLILTYRNIFCSHEHFLLPRTFFELDFTQRTRTTTKKAYFRTFERCSRSKMKLVRRL